MNCVRRFHVLKNDRLGKPLGKDELEDVIQETLFSVWEKLGEYEGRGPLEAWAYRFAYLRLLARIRKLHNRPRLIEDVDDVVLEPQAPPSPDAFRFEELYRGLERVPSPDQDLIRSKVFDQRTFEELAVQYDVPASTVKARFYRALVKLRGMLDSTDDEFTVAPGGKA